jgi:hypothetical protein
MFSRLVPIIIFCSLISYSLSSVLVGLAPDHSGYWSAGISLAVLGGVLPLISAVSVRIVPVFARRSWQFPNLVRFQLIAAITGGWLVCIGQIAASESLERAGHVIALAAGVTALLDLGILFRQKATGQASPSSSHNQRETDRFGTTLSRFAGVWLLAGLGTGVFVTFAHPDQGRWDLAWAHMLLLGYVMSMISGVCYHVLGRWTGVPWTDRRVQLARLHVRITLIAAPLMVLALAADTPWLFMVAGPVQAVALLLFLGAIAPFVWAMPSTSKWAMIFAGIFLGCGISLGAWFAGHPEMGPRFRMAHATLNIYGWIALIVSGVAYYLLPRMFGRPLRWPKLAFIQVPLGVISVGLLAGGWALRIGWQGPIWPITLGGFGVATGIGLLLINLVATYRSLPRISSTVGAVRVVTPGTARRMRVSTPS